MTEGVRNVHSPEELREKSITGSHMASLQVTEVQRVGGVGGVAVGGARVFPDIMSYNFFQQFHLATDGKVKLTINLWSQIKPEGV